MRHPQLRKLGFTDTPCDVPYVCHHLRMQHPNKKSALKYDFYHDTWRSYITLQGEHHDLFAAGHTEPEAVASAKHWLKKSW